MGSLFLEMVQMIVSHFGYNSVTPAMSFLCKLLVEVQRLGFLSWRRVPNSAAPLSVCFAGNGRSSKNIQSLQAGYSNGAERIGSGADREPIKTLT